MKIKQSGQVFAVYFSPTSGTKAYVEGIAERVSVDFKAIDLTKPENRRKTYTFTDRDLVVIGAPVYAGRLPSVEGGIFDGLRGEHTPAIFNVSYGNRDYDDALLEEKEICEDRGFIGIAAAAWIAPHSFSDKIAASRPDKEDETQIDVFVRKILKLLDGEGEATDFPLEVRGNHPYKALKTMPFHPIGNESCTDCHSCSYVCPTGAIDEENPRETNPEKCIDCFACVKSCPVHARGVFNPAFEGMRQKLESALTNIRKEPECFYPFEQTGS